MAPLTGAQQKKLLRDTLLEVQDTLHIRIQIPMADRIDLQARVRFALEQTAPRTNQRQWVATVRVRWTQWSSASTRMAYGKTRQEAVEKLRERYPVPNTHYELGEIEAWER